MQPQNIREYLEIRKEQTDLRSCVNLYVGFVVVGAGPALFGLITRSDARSSSILLAIFTTTLTSLILLLLYYKFTSHNRYVGYGKLLTHERYDCVSDTDLFGWEVCVDRLRARQSKEHELIALLTNPDISQHPSFVYAKHQLAGLCGMSPKSDRNALWNGIRLLFGSKNYGSSWRYPIHVTRILAIESTLFLSVVPFSLFRNGPAIAPLSSHIWLILLCMAGLGVTVVAWSKCLSDLSRLMRGSQTVDAFCWLFLPTRAALIYEIFDDPNYRLVGLDD